MDKVRQIEFGRPRLVLISKPQLEKARIFAGIEILMSVKFSRRTFLGNISVKPLIIEADPKGICEG